MTPEALRRLLALAEARKALDLARLEALAARDRALETDAAAARASLARDQADDAVATVPPAVMGRRIAWADHRARQARAGQEALRPALAEARGDAVRSLGKHRALEHLFERADRAQRSSRDARAERDAAPPQPREPEDEPNGQGS